MANFDHLPKSMNVRSRDPSLTWEGISWLKSITSLPIIVKGVLHPDDAVLAIKYGVAGMFIFSKVLHKGWSPKFATVLTIITGIVQKV